MVSETALQYRKMEAAGLRCGILVFAGKVVVAPLLLAADAVMIAAADELRESKSFGLCLLEG